MAGNPPHTGAVPPAGPAHLSQERDDGRVLGGSREAVSVVVEAEIKVVEKPPLPPVSEQVGVGGGVEMDAGIGVEARVEAEGGKG